MLKYRTTFHAGNVSTTPLLDHSDVFLTKSARIDNYSGRWLKVEPDGLYVPPWMVGMVVDFFVLAQRVSVYSQLPPGLGSPGAEADGIVTISLYDTPQYPFPGTPINPPQIQHPSPSGGDAFDINQLPTQYEMTNVDMAFGMYFAAVFNESFDHIQARQLVQHLVGVQACPAGVLTNFAGIVPSNNVQRLAHMIVSTDVTSLVRIDYSVYGPIWEGYIAANTPSPIPLPNNGLNLNGAAASRFQALHTVGGNVALTVGMMQR